MASRLSFLGLSQAKQPRTTLPRRNTQTARRLHSHHYYYLQRLLEWTQRTGGHVRVTSVVLRASVVRFCFSERCWRLAPGPKPTRAVLCLRRPKPPTRPCSGTAPPSTS